MIYCMGCMEQIDEVQKTCPYCGFAQTGQNKENLLPMGTVLQGRYIVGRAIGNGGFGVTYIGLDGQLNRKIAVKEFFPKKLAGRGEDGIYVTVENSEAADRFNNGLEQFLKEAKHLARLSHIPGIVYIYNYFYENGTGYIIMEYLEGKDLLTLLKEHGGKIPYEEARELVLSVLYILRNVHMNGILHRDIAPDNVFVTTDKVVKLIDFGAARHAARGKDDNTEILLKVGYAPVEQYSLDGKQGAWTDMYEVGALFYRMITGIKPTASIDRLREDDLVIPSELGVELPSEAEAAIMTSLNVESRYRIQNARDFMEALGGENFQPAEWTVETTVFEGDIEIKSRFFTKKRIALLISACILILTFGVGAAWMAQKDVAVVATNIKMADATGKSEDEAKELLSRCGVKHIMVQYIYIPDADGKVEYQNPEQGSSISPDVAVTLTVSSRERITLPELEPGKTYEEIEGEWKSKGITLKKKECYSEDVEKGKVVGYAGCAAGEILDALQPVPVEVSLGKRSDYETEVPDLRGMKAVDALKQCKMLNISVKKIKGSKENYLVKSQNIDPGKTINILEDKLILILEKTG